MARPMPALTRMDPVYVWGMDGREPEAYSAEERLPVFNRLDPACVVGTYVVEDGDTFDVVAGKFDIAVDDLHGANVGTEDYLRFEPGLQIVIPAPAC